MLGLLVLAFVLDGQTGCRVRTGIVRCERREEWCGGSGGRDDRRASLQCQVDGDGAVMLVRRAGCQWGPMETARRADVATVRQCGRGGEDSCMGYGEKWTLRGTAHGRATLAWRRSGGRGMGGA